MGSAAAKAFALAVAYHENPTPELKDMLDQAAPLFTPVLFTPVLPMPVLHMLPRSVIM